MAAHSGLQLHGERNADGDRRGLWREHRALTDRDQAGAQRARTDGLGQRRHRASAPVATNLETQRDLPGTGAVGRVTDEAAANLALTFREHGREAVAARRGGRTRTRSAGRTTTRA